MATKTRSGGRGPDERARRVDLLALGLGGLACLVLAGALGLETSAPANLRGDHLFIVAQAKSYIDGHGFRFNPQLGYPLGQDGLYFPVFELTHRLFLWLAGRVTDNPFRSVHALYVAGLLAMFGFGYWALRRFGVRPWISAIGAVCAVITPYLAFRTFAHDFLALSFAVPLGLGLALSLSVERPEASLKGLLREPFTLVAILVAGGSGLYYAFYSLMFLAFVGTAASLGQRRWFPTQAAGATGLLLFAVLLFSGYGLDLPLLLSGRFAGPHREAFQELQYGLNLPSAALAFEAWPKIAGGLARAAAEIPSAFGNEGEREWPAWPLTLTILAAPLIAAVAHGRRAGPDGRDDARLRLIGYAALCIAFGLLFGARGGLGFLFNLAFTPEIRANARLMPFLVFAAVIILSLVAETAASARARWLRWSVPALLGLAMAAAVEPSAGLLEKLQRRNLAGEGETLARLPAMLRAKDAARLAAVLQLPVTNWPEAPVVQSFDPYGHQLPYVFDRARSTTRWSYGANEKQPGYARMRFALGQPGGLAARARRFGFDGLLIEKAAYAPERLAALQAALAAQLAPACRIYEDGSRVLYALSQGPAGCGGDRPAAAWRPDGGFDLAQCVAGLEVAKGDGVPIPVGACVASPARTHVLTMQPSGALEVLPLTANGRPGAPVWSSGSRSTKPGGAQAMLQSDGNLVIYDQGGAALVWNSAAIGPVADFQLTVTDQGEAVIGPVGGAPVWSSLSGPAAPTRAP